MILLLLACSDPVSQPDVTRDDRGDPRDTAVSEDTGADTGTPGDTDQDTEEPQDTDDSPITVTRSTITVNTSCAMSAVLFEPSREGERLVVLAHGFARTSANMEGWAEALAAEGLTVVTPDLCHATMWDTDHVQNGRDLADLAATLGHDEVVYAGHSAGGLAALLAADQDPSAVGWFGLDPVDSEGLGAAVRLSVPATALVGEPSECNASASGADLDGEIKHISGADHCDFESPTDWMCTTFCPDAGGDVEDTIRAQLLEGALR